MEDKEQNKRIRTIIFHILICNNQSIQNTDLTKIRDNWEDQKPVVKSEPLEPLEFPGKPKNSEDIEIITLEDDDDEDENKEEGEAELQNGHTQSDDEPQAMVIKFYECPFKSTCPHKYQSKNDVEKHIANGHKIPIDVLKDMLDKGHITITEGTFQ